MCHLIYGQFELEASQKGEINLDEVQMKLIF
jgi:hypothetical protein